MFVASEMKLLFPVFICFGITACTTTSHISNGGLVENQYHQETAPEFVSNVTFEGGRKTVSNIQSQSKKSKKAKNIILMVGDGMGVSTVTAARIYSGQKKNQDGEGYVMAMETLPHSAFSKTYNTNQQVPDSAGTATALLSGYKTRAGVLNIGAQTERGDCLASLKNASQPLFETAKLNGLNTAVITTARITHATPAATYAKAADRNWETASDMPTSAKSSGCLPIADQLALSVNQGRLDIIMGGGAGKIDESLFVKAQILKTKSDLNSPSLQMDDPILGLFSDSHMTYSRLKSETSKEPSIAEMTLKSLQLLEGQKEGYIMLVEGGRIDHGHHAGKAELALEETYQFDLAVKAVLNTVNLEETLVIVTADHSHVFTLAGYPTKGNPILGQVYGNDAKGNPSGKPLLALDGRPYTTLGYHNGPGAQQGNRYPSSQSIEIQQAVIPTGSKASEGKSDKLNETHGGEDVPVFAAGPSSQLVSGVMEQNVIYHIMSHALRLDVSQMSKDK